MMAATQELPCSASSVFMAVTADLFFNVRYSSPSFQVAHLKLTEPVILTFAMRNSYAHKRFDVT